MKKKIHEALEAATRTKAQIAKIKDRFQIEQEEFHMADDAMLGAGWVIKRLKDLETAIQSKPLNGGAPASESR